MVDTVNGKNEEVELRTSRRFDVSGGEMSIWEEWVALFCWMVSGRVNHLSILFYQEDGVRRYGQLGV